MSKQFVETFADEQHWEVERDINARMWDKVWRIEHITWTYDLDRRSFVALVVWETP